MNTKYVLADYIDDFFERIARNALHYRWWVVVTFITFSLLGLYFVSKVQSDNSMNAYFNANDPTYVNYLNYLEEFKSDEITYILYRVPGSEHGPFDYQAMQKIAKISEELEAKVPFARDVVSLANVEFMWAEGDDLFVDELLIDFPENQTELLQVRDRLIKKPLYLNYLIDETLQYGAILIEMDRTSTDPLEAIILDPQRGTAMDNLYPQVTDHAVREVLNSPDYAGIEFYLSGDTIMNTAYNEIVAEESVIGILATLLLVMFVSFIMFRATLIGLLGPVTVVIISVIGTVAVIAILDWKLGIMFAMLPTLLCAVGVAQSVHILLEFQRQYDRYEDRHKATIEAIRKVGSPCMMAALTTAAGFAVMTVSDLKALSQLGVYSAIGVLLTFIITMSLLVIFIAGRNSNKKPKKSMEVHPMVGWIVNKTTSICLNHRNTILIVSALISAICIVGVTRINIDFNFLTDFKPKIEYRQHTEHTQEVMGGMLNLTFAVDSGMENGMKSPALLSAIDNFQQFAETQPLVKKTLSITNVVKDLNQSLNGDDALFYRIPESKNLIAQYLLLYEISGGEEMDEFVTDDFQRGVIELRVEMTDSSKVEVLLNDLDAYLKQNPLPDVEVSQTGIGLMWVKMGDYIADTQLKSYSLIFLMVALVMTITFGSIKIGLLSMIPNLAPVIVALGVMGWLNIPLDFMKLLLATVAIGIAVDDTIHLVTRFRSRFMESGNYEYALRTSFQDVGPALVITSTILVVAFLSYLMSSTTILASFGILLGATILVALIADLLTLPALFLWLKPFGPERQASNDES